MELETHVNVHMDVEVCRIYTLPFCLFATKESESPRLIGSAGADMLSPGVCIYILMHAGVSGKPAGGTG